jgi:hypothetical protein
MAFSLLSTIKKSPRSLDPEAEKLLFVNILSRFQDIALSTG